MKTEFPDKIQTKQEAEDFLFQLIENEEFIDLDDLQDYDDEFGGVDDYFVNKGEYLWYKSLMKDVDSVLDDRCDTYNQLSDPNYYSNELNYLRECVVGTLKVLIRNSYTISSVSGDLCIGLENDRELVLIDGELVYFDSLGKEKTLDSLPLDNLIQIIKDAR